MTFSCPEIGVDYPVFTTRPDTLFGATFFVMAPEHPDVMRLAAGTEHEAGRARVRQPRAGREHARSARDAERDEDRRAARPHASINPVNGERIPMFVADYVLMEYGTGAIMAVPGPRRARLRVRDQVRPADPARRRAGRRARRGATSRSPPTPATRCSSTPAAFDGMPRSQAKDAIIDWLDARGSRPPLDQLPAARLAALPPALLGLPDPDRLLRQVRDRARAGRGPAGRAARRRGLHAAGPLAAGRGRGLGQHDVPALRRPGAPRDRHDGHVRRLVLVLPALLRRRQRRGRRGIPRSPTAGCPSTSTSAASSTRSCTCCTRASSSRRSPTWGCWRRRSRSSACSRRA